MVSICFCLSFHPCVHISISARAWIRTILQKYQTFCAKSLCGVAKKSSFFNSSITLIKDTGEENWFSVFTIVSKACSYGLKLSNNIKIKYLVHFEVFFYIPSIFHTGCLSSFKKPSRFHENQCTYDKIKSIYLKTTIIDGDILKHED